MSRTRPGRLGTGGSRGRNRPPWHAWVRATLPAVLAAALTPGAAALDVTFHVEPDRIEKIIAPGAVGWGAMWKRDMLWPPPGPLETDEDHARYLAELAHEGRALARAADLRNVSWPWGVSFSTWGVNWENSARPWSERPADCARIALLNLGSGWCERTVVGVGDLIALARSWELEAITVAVPLSVLDGTRVRWGPDFVTHVIDAGTRAQIVAHARALVDYMKEQPGWDRLARVYLAAGCEWRHYGQPAASRSYADLVKAIREAIPEEKVIVVASASDSADLNPFQANDWNRPLYGHLRDTEGIALDLHRYRGTSGLEAAADGTTAATSANVDWLAGIGVTQRGYFTVHPGHWGGEGPAMPSVLLENAIHGLVHDHTTHSAEPWPWPVVIAHASLAHEALASPAMTFLGWTWFPEDLPREWPHGAIGADGRLTLQARAQAFLSRFHRGVLLGSRSSHDGAVRASAVRGPDERLRLYGGNFSRDEHSLTISGTAQAPHVVEYFSLGEIHRSAWDGSSPVPLPPMTLWRIESIGLPRNLGVHAAGPSGAARSGLLTAKVRQPRSARSHSR